MQNIWAFVLFHFCLLYTIFIQCANSQYQFHYQRIKKVFGKTSTFWYGSDRSHHSIFKNSRLSWYETSPFEYLEQMPLIVYHVVPPKVWALLSCRLCWRRLCPWWSDDSDDDLMISWSVDLMIWLSDDQRVLISSVVFCKTHIQRFHFSASADNVHGFYF